MKQLSSLFAAYKKKLQPPQSSVEKVAVTVIQDVTKLPVTSDYVVVYTPASRVLRLQAPSIIKTEVLQHKAAIMTRLRAELGEAGCPTDLQ